MIVNDNVMDFCDKLRKRYFFTVFVVVAAVVFVLKVSFNFFVHTAENYRTRYCLYVRKIEISLVGD